jgi:hypothetical protein
MTNEQRIVRLVQQLDQERTKRIHAERQAKALRLTIMRLMAERRVARAPREAEQPRAC